MNEIIITPLGTVSPYSKESHNCPGFLIEYQEEKSFIRLWKRNNKITKFSQRFTKFTHYNNSLS